MSSYITSQFAIEENRLLRIAAQCENDLQNAIRAAQNQANVIAEIEFQQECADKRFHSEVAQSRKKAEQAEKEKMRREQAAKEQADQLVHEAIIEVEALSEQGSVPASSLSELRQIQWQLSQSISNLDEVKKRIHSIVKAAEREVKKDLVGKIHGEQSPFSKNAFSNRKYTSVPLFSANVVQSQQNIQHSVSEVDVFYEKINTARKTAGVRIPTMLLAIEKEFKAQPDYARTAYAVKNMKKLDDILAKINRQSENNKAQNHKYEEKVNEYLAFCSLLGLESQVEYCHDPHLLHVVEQECLKMRRMYQEKKQQEYINNSVRSVMEKHGISFTDASSSGMSNVMHFSVDSSASVAVSGNTGDSLVLEVSGLYNGNSPTLNEQRKSIQAAKHFCSLFGSIEEELHREYGISFLNARQLEPSESTIVMKKNSSSEQSHDKLKKAKASTVY